ncbi:GerAB/ArcD/ProY family transporter [Niallia sp. 01092]|uniref:GerAB/ArcD/ProY family transporter n=1 Tax=unclassified Niallia TaxID=2837522 RepID=UPI003FD664C6
MLEKGKIESKQFTVLVFMFTTGSSLLLAPSMVASESKQDAWLAAIFGVVVGVLLTWLYQTLGNRYSDMTLVEYSEKILGKWIGKVIALLFFTFPFLLAALVLRNIGDFMTTQIMPETPIQSIHIIFLIVVMMGTRMGIEPFARAAELLFPWFIVLFIFLVCFTSPQIKLQNIQPVLEDGMKPILRAILFLTGFPFLELVVFLMIFPYVNRSKEAGQAFRRGTWLGGAVLIVLTALAILVIGADLTTRNLYPSYVLAKKINVGDFLQRIEAIMAGMWFIAIFFKLTVCFYASTLSLAQTLKLNDYRILVFPLGMILIVLSLVISPDIVYDLTVVFKIWTPHAITLGFFVPLLLLGVAAVRKIKG